MSPYDQTEPRADRPTSSTWIGSHITEVVLGGGFLLGISMGAVFLFAPTDKPVVNSHAAAATPSAGSIVESASEPNDAAGELAAERDRLQRELESEKLRLEVEALRRQLVDLKSSPVSVEPPRELPGRGRRLPVTTAQAPAAPSPAAVPSVSPGDATLAYWNRMNAVILQEAAMRSAPAGGITAANAGGFLDARIQAAEFAVDAIRQLDAAGVDAQVVALGEQLAKWYADGGKVAATGKELLTAGSMQERQGSAGKRYQAAERSHSQSVGAVNAAGEQVRQEMSRKYGLNFPPLN